MIVNYLAACAMVEERAAEIYRAMAASAKAGNHEELQQVWLVMAADEDDHAQQVRLAARLSREKVFDRGKETDEQAPLALLEQAEELLGQVKNRTLSELEMLQTAVEMEKKFCQVHTNNILIFTDPSMKKMFDALARGDEKHLAKLKELIKRFETAEYSG